MVVIAHAADGVFFAPVLVFIIWISYHAIRDRLRERREGHDPSEEQS